MHKTTKLRSVVPILVLVTASQSLTLADSSGTGFLISQQGYIVTNFHVVRECKAITISNGSFAPLPAVLVASDPGNDLALLKGSVRDNSPILALRSARPRLAESVIAMGYPLKGVSASSVQATIGNVSALAGPLDDTRALQFTAPIQPGNSGGPLLDAWGDVVGVVTSRLSTAWSLRNIGDLPQNVNFALKSSTVAAFLDSNGLVYQTTPGHNNVAAGATSDVAESAGKAVLLIQCEGSRPLQIDEQTSDKSILIAGEGKDSVVALATDQLHAEILAANVPAARERKANISIKSLLERVSQSKGKGLLHLSLSVSKWNWRDRLVVTYYDSSGSPLWKEESTSLNYITESGQVTKLVRAVVPRVLQRLSER